MRVLCVCTGNTCRSPMLQVLLARALKDAGIQADVESAGIAAEPGYPASSQACAVMATRGLDLSGHQSRPITGLDLGKYSHVLAIGPRHADVVRKIAGPTLRIVVLGAESGGIADPYGGSEAVYEACAKELELEIKTRILPLLMDNK